MDKISISSLSAPTGMAVNSLLTCDIILQLLTTAESKHNHHHNRHFYTTHHALKYSTHSRTQQEVGGAGITVGWWVCVAQCLWVCPDCPSSPPPPSEAALHRAREDVWRSGCSGSNTDWKIAIHAEKFSPQNNRQLHVVTQGFKQPTRTMWLGYCKFVVFGSAARRLSLGGSRQPQPL